MRAAASRSGCTAAPREWARGEAARRLGDAASRTRPSAPVLRAAEDDLAGGVVELQAGASAPSARDGDRHRGLPVQGAGVVRRRRRRVLLRPRAARRRAGRAAGRRAAHRHRRAVGQRQVLGPAGRACWRRWPAGVLPGSERWAIALLRPGEQPLRALEQAIAALRRERRLIVAVDQFEELFTACRDEDERAAFADALTACTRDPRRRTLVLVAVRADFYGRCAAYPELSRLLGANHVLVGPMRRDELRRAIELPARQRAGLRVEPELVDALLADVEGEPGALPLLSTALLELWQQRDGRRLRLRRLRAAPAACAARSRGWPSARTSGSTAKAARSRAGSCCGSRARARATPSCAAACRWPSSTGAGVAEVLSVLADERLVTIGEGEVEVAHEALLREWPRLRAWLEEDAEGRRLHQHLTARRARLGGGRARPGELYRGARLAAALDWSATHAASSTRPSARSSTASRARASERSQRRLRGAAGRSRRAARAGSRGRRRRARAARQRTRRGDRGRRAAPGRPRAGRERARPLAAARAPGRGTRRHGADARQSARGAASRARPRSG